MHGYEESYYNEFLIQDDSQQEELVYSPKIFYLLST